MKIILVIFASLAVLQIIAARKANSELDCRPNESFSTCGTCYERVCGVSDFPIACPEMCFKGCFCDAGYIRKQPNGACITEKRCLVIG
ncbi:chymotrypsin-elastase inhibitor ixodidin-like [Uranotaenia lowii]|uniref:chymotrypsin-elastase inhibitor ixodidin-like n=1 Tax=Uranotaenia lowii TaxID=190385 RepID=UPI002479AF9C|nr:chymotrypsin-elastase inhibitor ixodidin-like [Uranotaenia lowii]